VSLYYYLRLFVTLFGEVAAPATLPEAQTVQRPEFFSWTAVCSLGFVASIILLLGVYPEPLIHLIRDSVSNLLMVAVQRP
jgi:NADH:ubiquinone oxidoreductase subunit 4 (subunit M)